MASKMGFGKGDVKLLNNIVYFQCRRAVEICKGLAQCRTAYSSGYYNTVLYSWARTKDNTDMGYEAQHDHGRYQHPPQPHRPVVVLRHRPARGSIPTPNQRSRRTESESDNNVFFLNKQIRSGLPSGGGVALRVFVDQMEDAEGVTGVAPATWTPGSRRRESRAQRAPYLRRFLSATYKEKTDYDPNSASNFFRRALGMNQVGTIQTSVSMYNRCPLGDALKLFERSSPWAHRIIAKIEKII